MLEFIITFSVYGIMFLPILIVLLVKERDKKLKLQVGAGIIAFWLFWASITTLTFFADENDWNNGTCIECNGSYELKDITPIWNRPIYYYSCKRCGHTIETRNLME